MNWRKEEIERFSKVWVDTPIDELLVLFPDRTLKSMEGMARRLRLKRIRMSQNTFSGSNSSFKSDTEASKMSLEKIKLDELLEEVSKRGFISQQREVLVNRQYSFPRQKKPFKIGVVSDTHLGSEHQQLTYLRETYKIFQKEGVKKVLHAGDVIEGNGRLFKGQQYEMFLHGADAMIKYTVEAYPNIPGITTYMIAGSHDYSFYKDAGTDVLKNISKQRPDIKYLGVSGAYINLNGLKIYLMHGAGGNAYARSYRMQKIIENFPPDKKPNILLLGHYHVTDSLPWYRNVTGFQLPCFQTQTQYLKAKGLAPDLGFLILEITPNARGVASFKPDWHPFYSGIDGDY